MKTQKITWQLARDYHALMECEHCGHVHEIKNGYHDEFFRTQVIPSMQCPACQRSTEPAGMLKAACETALAWMTNVNTAEPEAVVEQLCAALGAAGVEQAVLDSARRALACGGAAITMHSETHRKFKAVYEEAAKLLGLMDEVPIDPRLGDETDRVFPSYEFDDLRDALAHFTGGAQ